MKNIKFYIIILLLVIGCTWAIIKLYQAEDVVKQYQTEKEKQVKAVVTEAKELSRKVDEKGIEQVLFDVTDNKATQAQLKDKASTKGIIDTTAMALDIRTKQLQTMTAVNGTLAAENLKLKRQLDANQRPFYTYSGQGLSLKFTPPNDLDTASQGTADFSADVRITATQYWKRNWFLGSKKSILAVSSNSQLFKINGADFVEFEQNQPVFGLRIQAGANYNPQTGSIGFGPGARFDAGRFSFQGNYTWYPESERWRPSVNVNYDLLRF
jgi:uncharacterized protein YcfL